MIQQINLYQPSDAGKRPAILDPYLLAIVIVCLGLLVITGIGWNERLNNRNRLQELQAQLAESQSRLDKLQAQYPNRQVDSLLKRELQQTQSLYQNLSELAELLSDSQSDRVRGFSRYLKALAEQADDKVWLTGIEIDAETGEIGLRGSSFTPERIPFLLQRLQASDAFKGRLFAKLSVRQSEDEPGLVDFSVGSNVKTGSEASDERRR